MRIGYLVTEDPGATDALLRTVAAEFGAAGLCLAGVVRTEAGVDDRHPCDKDIRILPDGPDVRISQALGTGARGCRLDPGALEEAVALVATGFDRPLDLFILNKFGKHEAAGRGFCGLIAEAAAREVPVLLAVNTLNRAAFEGFAGGMAIGIAPSGAAVRRWYADCTQRAA